MKRPPFWIGLALLAAVAAFVAIRYFPTAFSIVALDIRMDRETALAEARAIMAREGLGPADFRQAASFSLDQPAQTFVELEGGGKDAFTRMLRDELYSAYTWRVRHFREGDPHETTIRFTPAGRSYGFVEHLDEQAPGAALDLVRAREIAEAEAARGWKADLSAFTLVEQGQDRRVGGRVDHTLTYERESPTLNDGRYRLRLTVSGDRLTEVTYSIRIPEAFERRYANMRAANDAIGIGSALGMAVLYVFGGIGVGLFFMLRRRWIIWRAAARWGAAVALLQALTMINGLPLLWMTYDTAVPPATFLAQQAALVLASFIGFSAFFALSFMAAETLTRRAFGHHPQLWRLWSKRPAPGTAEAPGASTAILGRTAAGLLLVPVFLAYQVILYFAATRYFGWWSPSEALLYPDVLATYVPWLSAIANSLQAGFWEEALFRAVPLAAAALVGERLGRRRLFLVFGFVLQAVIFGAGHAQYAAQPAYARLVELFLPSIGFGVLYLYFGLLPAIVLHYAFDAVLFGLPIFLASGIWFQKFMVALLTLAPMWIVLWRRVQVGRWTGLADADRNAAWTPPPADQVTAPLPITAGATLGTRMRAAWLGAGAVGLVVVAGNITSGRADRPALALDRHEAARLARQAVEDRGAVLDPRWRIMAVASNGSWGAHEFVSATAGEDRRRELLGRYLPDLHWRVRIATFEGDVVERAEEWQVLVSPTGKVRNVQHVLPEARAGASLDEAAARRIAMATVAERFGLDAARGDVSDVSARPVRLSARTDWTFTVADRTIAPLPQGEPRIAVTIAGDQAVSTGRSVYVPDEWQRRQRAAESRNLILRVLATVVLAALLVGGAVLGMIAWSRRQFVPRMFVAVTLTLLTISGARSVNNWPAVMASLPTAAPLPLQVLGAIGVALIGLALLAALVGLIAGATPPRLGTSLMPDRDALRLGTALGLFGAAGAALSAWLRTPPWARLPDIDAAAAFVPLLQAAIDPLSRVLMVSAVLLAAFELVHRVTAGWTRRRAAGAVILLLLGFAGSGMPVGLGLTGWAAGGLVAGAALLAAYGLLLRFDRSLVPLAVATMTAAGALARGAERAYAGALPGAALGAVLALALGWWLFAALRRATAAGTPAAASPARVT